MLTRVCSRLRIICKLPESQKKHCVYKKGCHRALIYPTMLLDFCSKCAPHCWKCGSEIQNSTLFCSQCTTLQKPNEKNYFDILGIEQSFEVKDKELKTKYHKLQNVLHPDRFNAKNVEERDISERYSALVNKAYSTLLHPLARGLYMLQLHGVNLDEETRQSDPQFLAEIMQANEELAEAQHPEDVKELDNANRSTVEKLIR
ncbi:iron-sulfur cluster co-chaperone protein HscB, mitochondrial isoform X2 [Zootermopsis nevadensis]|nr:iron-sulfur cluster co-chaperone protein HscB, mitochondrial isoform X2 [Zootermopsis nevadensis]